MSKSNNFQERLMNVYQNKVQDLKYQNNNRHIV